MTRPDWQNLNGEWQLRQSATDDAPQFGATLPERVNVPFAVESALSGVMRPANDNRHYLFYRRTFTVPARWSGRQVQLHFGAVDWQTTVYAAVRFPHRRNSTAADSGVAAGLRTVGPDVIALGSRMLAKTSPLCAVVGGTITVRRTTDDRRH
jgi:hypothetical protein